MLKFIQYSFVGGIAGVVHYSLLVVVVELLNVHPALGSIMGAFLGALVAYAGNYYITFKSNKEHLITLLRFAIIATVGLVLNGGIVWIGTDGFGLHYVLAQIVATIFALILTFNLNRFWTFN